MSESRPGGRVMMGVARLARGRADGITLFPSTVAGFLTSLAPLVAFPLVGGLMAVFQGEPRRGLADVLATVSALLAPAVISHAFARRWGREEQWLRFATAFNWCQWALPLIAMVLLTVTSVLGGSSSRLAAVATVLGLAAYGLWLHWFVVRQGLLLGAARSVLVVICMNLGTAAVILLPRALAVLSSNPPPLGAP